jgi:site-specific DNA-methyltransferase (adenine-specific)
MKKIILGNCIELMKSMKDKSVDLILTDPPYNAKNIGTDNRVYSSGPMQLPLEEYKKFCNDWITEALRIAKTVVFTSGISNICYYPQPNWILCWSKPQAVSFNRMGGFNVWEPILVYGKTAKGKRLERDLIEVGVLNLIKGPQNGHPCPKPPVLMAKLLDKFSNENDLVLDPFNGSGTTVVMAKVMKRRYLGMDINENYNQIAELRLSQEVLF